MKQILAIAGLAVKAAVKSRLFLTLMVILVIVTIGLPLSIKGDGTLSGRMTLVLYYSLGLTKIILGIATVWVSCWAISWEVEGKYIQTMVVKPIHRFHIWIGKWLGILFMNAVLLALAGSITYVMLGVILSRSDANQEDIAVVKNEVLACRRRVEPDREDMSREAHDLMYKLKKSGEIHEDTPDDEIYEEAYRRVMAANRTVSPGKSKKWRFNLRKEFQNSSKVTLRYYLSIHTRERNPVSGKWIIGTESDPEAYVSEMDNYLFGRHMLDVPLDVLAGEEQLVVTFVNSDRNKSNVAVFDMQDDMELLIDSGGFVGNYVRTVIILFCHLALLAALGLTAGSLLTFPVASFSVISLLVISLLSYYFSITYGTDSGHHHHNHDCGIESEASGQKNMMEELVVHMNIVVAPAMRFHPIEALADGLLVSWKDTSRAVLVLLLLYPGVFGLLGAWFLNRRELALPV